jgi:hypothetical protein
LILLYPRISEDNKEIGQSITSIMEDSDILSLSTQITMDRSGGSHGNSHGNQWPLFLHLIQLEIYGINIDRCGAGSGKSIYKFIQDLVGLNRRFFRGERRA